jgi:hypothetical protein
MRLHTETEPLGWTLRPWTLSVSGIPRISGAAMRVDKSWGTAEPAVRTWGLRMLVTAQRKAEWNATDNKESSQDGKAEEGGQHIDCWCLAVWKQKYANGYGRELKLERSRYIWCCWSGTEVVLTLCWSRVVEGVENGCGWRCWGKEWMGRSRGDNSLFTREKLH